MNKCHLMMLTLSIGALAACSSVPQSTQNTAQTGYPYFSRKPASELRPPLVAGTKLRVLKSMRLEPVNGGGMNGVFISQGRILSASEVKEMTSSKAPAIKQYCVLYVNPESKKFALKKDELLDVADTPEEASWEPGFTYDVKAKTAVTAVGCFSMTENTAHDVTEDLFRAQLNGIFELTK